MRSTVLALRELAEAERLASVAAATMEPGAAVQVVHVIEPGPAKAPLEGRAAVETGVGRLRDMGFAAEAHVVSPGEGDVADCIAEEARHHQAELVVIGARGLGAVGGFFGRSVSHGLLAKLDLPILISSARTQAPPHSFRRALLALVGEHEVEPAAAAIGHLPEGLEVLAVHAPRAFALHTGDEPGRSFFEAPETSDVVLRAARLSLSRQGVRVGTRDLPRQGVASAIARIAREWDADLIVLGSRRLRQWEALLVGSTSHDAIRLSDRPVLVAGKQSHPHSHRRHGAAPAEEVAAAAGAGSMTSAAADLAEIRRSEHRREPS
ncbi:MAG: universal stress protein [Candidatus Dormibacteraeota bacterium]|nr:universal stress protein [Candidatus Dormibacteraeota bacterium]